MTDPSVGKFDFLCRLCMTSLVNGAYEIFEENTQIWKKITVCLQIKIEQNDELPKSICKSCITKLDDFYSYRESCLRTEVILINCISNCNSTSQRPLKSDNKENDDTEKEKIDDNENETSPKESGVEESLSEEKKLAVDNIKKETTENNISDVEMSPSENVGLSEDEEDEEMDEDKEGDASIANANPDKSPLTRTASLPELAEPSPEDYVLMKEETFNLDPVKDVGTSRGATSSILADYLIEFSNSKSGENDMKDKDVMESQRLRREVLPPMWDVYEKSITEKENICADGTNGEKERTVKVTHRRYIINKGAFPCSLCGECFEFDQGKRRDDFSEEKSKLYDCLTCGKVFPRRSSWKRHQSTHEDVKPFVCRMCNKGFNRKEHLSRHLLSHGSVRPYSCNVCSKQFVRKEHLTRHQLCNPACAVPVDNVLRPFGCDVCSQGFVRKEHLIRHRKRAHDLDPPEGEAEPKPFTCNVCTKTFTRREHLKRHQLIHQRDFSNSSLSSLGARLFGTGVNSKDDSYHSEVSIFPTTPILPEITLSEIGGGNDDSENRMYDSSLQNSSSMMENNDGDHLDESVQYGIGCGDEDVEMDDDADEPLPPIPVLEMNTNAVNITPTVADITKSNTFCNVCFKNFSRRSHLLRHMKRIHSMQLPPSSRRKPQQQSQPTVPQQPKSAGDENGNSLTDSSATAVATPTPPEQTYKCQLCGKVFSRRSHLERHEKNIHQLDKEANQPYECVTCGATFIQSKLLDKHMQVHGNTVPENYVWM